MNITAWTTFETPEQRLIGEASRKVVTAITARNFKAPLKWVEEPEEPEYGFRVREPEMPRAFYLLPARQTLRRAA